MRMMMATTGMTMMTMTMIGTMTTMTMTMIGDVEDGVIEM